MKLKEVPPVVAFDLDHVLDELAGTLAAIISEAAVIEAFYIHLDDHEARVANLIERSRNLQAIALIAALTPFAEAAR